MSKNKEKFLDNFKKYSKILKDNMNLLGIKETEKAIVSKYTLRNMTRTIISEILNDNETILDYFPKAFYDKIDKDEVKFIFGRAVEEIKDKESEEYIQLNSFINDSKNGKSFNTIFNEIKTNYNKYNKTTLAPFFKILKNNIETQLNKMSSIESINLIQELIEKNIDTISNFPDENSYFYISDHPELATHPYTDKLNSLKGNDPDFDKLAPEIDNFFSYIQDDASSLSHVAESAGETSIKILMNGYNDYLTKFKVKNIENLVNNYTSLDTFVTLYKENNVGSIHLSNEFKDTILKSIEKLNTISKDNETTLSGLFFADNDKLKEAIEKKDIENIKKYYTKTNSKIKVVDEIIKDLKQIDSKNHLFNSNQSSTREEYYPTKYRFDFEGTTLFNQMMYINTFCKEVNVKPDVFLDNPVKYIKKYLSDFEKDKKNNDLISCLHGKDIFNTINTLKTKLFDVGLVNSYNNKIAQIGNCLAVTNPEERYETYHKLNTEFFTANKLYLRNINTIKDALENLNILSEQVIPGLIICKDEYNPYEMLNLEEGIYDSENSIIRDKFEISEYINSHNIEEIFERIKENSNTLEETYKNHKNYNLFNKGIKQAKNAIKTALIDLNIGCSEEEINNYVDIKTSTEKTNIKQRTTISKVEFYKNIKDGVNNTTIKSSIENIANLKKNYDSHNFLAKLVNPSLWKQNRMIKQMKNHLVNNNLDIKKIDNAIKLINKGEGNTVDYNNLTKNNLPKSNLPKIDSKKPLEISNNIFDIDIVTNKENSKDNQITNTLEKENILEENPLTKE